MAGWTHLICEDCWNERHPTRRAVKVSFDDGAPCCFCGKDTSSGIYVREDPATLDCRHKVRKAVGITHENIRPR